MKRSELIDNLENEDYSVYSRENYLEVVHNNSNDLSLMISEEEMFVIISYGKSCNVDEYIFEICCRYSATPLEEREERKKYRLKLPNTQKTDYESYLNYNLKDKTYFIGDATNIERFKTEFTAEETGNLPEQAFIQTLIKEEVE